MEKFDVDVLLEDIELSCKELLTKNRFKLHMFYFSKYEGAEECFEKQEENEDFFNMIEHIAVAYNQCPAEVYADTIEARYPKDGKFYMGAADRFVAALSLYELKKEDIK